MLKVLLWYDFFCNRYDRSQTNTQQLRIGVVKELVLQLTISNKASDYAYYSKLLVKYPRSLAYQRTGDVSGCKI